MNRLSKQADAIVAEAVEQGVKFALDRAVSGMYLIASLWLSVSRIDELIKAPNAIAAYTKARLEQLVEQLRTDAKEYKRDSNRSDPEAKANYNKTLALIVDLENEIKIYTTQKGASLKNLKAVCEELSSTLEIQAIQKKGVKLTKGGRRSGATPVKKQIGSMVIEMNNYESNESNGRHLLEQLQKLDADKRGDLETKMIEALNNQSYRMRQYISECVIAATSE